MSFKKDLLQLMKKYNVEIDFYEGFEDEREEVWLEFNYTENNRRKFITIEDKETITYKDIEEYED